MPALAASHLAPSAAALPRANGTVRVTVTRRGGCSALRTYRAEGSAKALFPESGPGMVEAVLINTAGGITGGDRFAVAAEVDAGAALSLTTQAAERGYRALPGETGRIEVRLSAGPAARLDWLPQETILFDRSALARRIEADLAPGARLLAAESVVLGRAAMGERLTTVRFSDQWRVRRGGRLVFADAVRLGARLPEALAGPATLDGAGAVASILYAADDAEARLDRLRALMPPSGGASLVRPGILVARLRAPGARALRHALCPLLEFLRQAPLPRVWSV